MDDFDDVSSKEKAFMKIWNWYMKSHSVVSDKSMPTRCLEFAKLNIQRLLSLDLRENFLLHLFNLWDEGVVSSMHIGLCMSIYDAHYKSHIQSTYPTDPKDDDCSSALIDVLDIKYPGGLNMRRERIRPGVDLCLPSPNGKNKRGVERMNSHSYHPCASRKRVRLSVG